MFNCYNFKNHKWKCYLGSTALTTEYDINGCGIEWLGYSPFACNKTIRKWDESDTKAIRIFSCVHSSAMVSLVCSTNLPKEIMGYPDFPIPDQKKSYIPQRDMLSFLELYAQRFNVYERIKFQHYVIRVRPRDDKKWEIIIRDLPRDKYETYFFDAVIVCNGHYNTPAFPDYPGRQLYKGQQIHSHNYRCADPFEGM